MFRNKEIQKFTIIFIMITIASIGAGLAIHPAAAVLALICAVLFGTAFFIFTKARYKSIARISEQIDLILHNADRIYVSEAEEGELSILQSEITKMTLRIREQNSSLKREKEHLADSLADVAHQLRTPLTSMNLILSLLAETPDEEERKDFLRESEEMLMQMDWLITSLLKLSRLDAGVIVFNKEQVDVKDLIHTSVHPFLISMDIHNITLKTTVPENVTITGDSNWLSEAVKNILKNSIENAGDNGLIEIDCEDTPLFTEITIHDSGRGFEKEDLPRLFNRFYRGKNSDAAGYGIGLALCKTIIMRQNGIIAAKNHPKGGAVFMIRFPK